MNFATLSFVKVLYNAHITLQFVYYNAHYNVQFVTALGFEPRMTESKSVVLPLHHAVILF